MWGKIQTRMMVVPQLGLEKQVATKAVEPQLDLEKQVATKVMHLLVFLVLRLYLSYRPL